jgi:hypothetical protein
LGEDIEAVKAGMKTPAEVLAKVDSAKPVKPAATPPKPIAHPFQPTTPLQHDLLAGWVRLCDSKVAITERGEARDVMRAILMAEEAASRSSEGGGK